MPLSSLVGKSNSKRCRPNAIQQTRKWPVLNHFGKTFARHPHCVPRGGLCTHSSTALLCCHLSTVVVEICECANAMMIETFQNDVYPDTEISVMLFESVTNCNDLKKLAMTGALDAVLLNPSMVRNMYYRPCQCGR